MLIDLNRYDKREQGCDRCMHNSFTHSSYLALQALLHCHCDLFLDGLRFDLKLSCRLVACVQSISVESFIINYLTYDVLSLLILPQPRIDSFFMTYHDGNRAARFRSSRLGAAVEQITGKRTELSLGFTKTAKPRKARAPSQAASEKPSTAGKAKGKARAKKAPELSNDEDVPASVPTVNSVQNTIQSQALDVTAMPTSATHTPASAAAASTSHYASYEESESDDDVFDDNYKKRRKRKI